MEPNIGTVEKKNVSGTRDSYWQWLQSPMQEQQKSDIHFMYYKFDGSDF